MSVSAVKRRVKNEEIIVIGGKMYVRVNHVQGVLSISPSTIYRWRKDGLIKIHKRGPGVSLISIDEFEKLLEAS